jgi:TRAP-type C4-dicarboxylate transport system substrate-binding protein
VRRLTQALVLVAVGAAIAGCSQSRPRAHVLRLATANRSGIEHDPALGFFAARVAQRSGGRLRIAFDDRWGRDGNAHEAALIGDVARGRAELGVVATRSLARAGARGMAVLDAPLLVDRYSLQAAVLASPLAVRLQAGTRAAGLEGLALLAGPLAHPVGTRGPVRRAADARHRNFYVRDPGVAARAAHALGAFPHPLTLQWLNKAYVTGPRSIEAPAVYEDGLDALFFDRYGAQCAAPDRDCRTMGPWVTVNVALWPRMSAIVANPAALARLSPRQRAWLRAAAADAARRSTTVGHADQRILDELCAAGVRAALAPPAGIAELAHAWHHLYDRLPARAIHAIERLKQSAPPDPPLRIPAGCGKNAPHAGPARGVSSTIPDGVYRVRITRADLRAASATGADDRPGIATLTLRAGHWHLALTEPGERLEEGTYAGTPPRTAWTSEGPAGRDEAYMSVAVGPGGALRFNVARADDLPHTRAMYASHPWRRIGA